MHKLKTLCLIGLMSIISVSSIARSFTFQKCTPNKYKATRRSDVFVYTTKTDVPASAFKIGTILCHSKKHLGFVLEKCKIFAAENGGHAIYAESASPISSGAKVANSLLFTRIKGDFEVAVYRLEQ